jgi:hypothetical protein
MKLWEWIVGPFVGDRHVPIDIRIEEPIRLSDVPKLKVIPLNRYGKRISIKTLYRWALTGTAGVRLETIKVGGTTCTSVEALQRFLDELTRQRDAGRPVAAPRPVAQWSVQRQREIEAAQRRTEEILWPKGRKQLCKTHTDGDL